MSEHDTRHCPACGRAFPEGRGVYYDLRELCTECFARAEESGRRRVRVRAEPGFPRRRARGAGTGTEEARLPVPAAG